MKLSIPKKIIMIAALAIAISGAAIIISARIILLSYFGHIEGINTAIFAATLTAVGITIVFTILAGFLGNRVSRPVRDAIDIAVQVADGNHDIPLNKSGNDEAGQLIDALQAMVERQNEQLWETEKLNARVLQEAAKTKKLIDEIALARDAAGKTDFAGYNTINNMSLDIRAIINDVLDITEGQLMNQNLDPVTKTDFENLYNKCYILLGKFNNIFDLSKEVVDKHKRS